MADAAAVAAERGVHAAFIVAISDIGYTAQVTGVPVIGARTLAEVAAWLRDAPEAYFPLGFHQGDHDWLSQYSMNRHFPVPH